MNQPERDTIEGCLHDIEEGHRRWGGWSGTSDAVKHLRLLIQAGGAAEKARSEAEIDTLYREIESWRGLVEDFKRDITLWQSGKTFKEVYPLSEAPTPKPDTAATREGVPSGVWEALQRLIENAATLGPASQEDALLVAKYRSAALYSRPEGEPPLTDADIERIAGRDELTGDAIIEFARALLAASTKEQT